MRGDPEAPTMGDLLWAGMDVHDAIRRRTKHGVEVQARRVADDADLARHLEVRFDAAVSTLLREAAWNV